MQKLFKNWNKCKDKKNFWTDINNLIVISALENGYAITLFDQHQAFSALDYSIVLINFF